MAMTAQKTAGDPALGAILGPAAIGAVIGVKAWQKHPLLGLLAGEAIGANVYRLYRNQGNDRTLAWTNMATSAAGIAGSLMSPKNPFRGWAVGYLLGIGATSLVKDSAAYNLRKSLGF